MIALKPSVHQSGHQHERDPDPRLGGRPRRVGGEADLPEQVVEDADARVEDEAEQEADDHDAEHVRREARRRGRTCGRGTCWLSSIATNERHDHEQRDAQQREQPGGEHGLPERRRPSRRPGVNRSSVVLQPDPGLGGEELVPVVQRDPQAVDRGDRHEDREQQQVGRHEQPRRPRPWPSAPAFVRRAHRCRRRRATRRGSPVRPTAPALIDRRTSRGCRRAARRRARADSSSAWRTGRRPLRPCWIAMSSVDSRTSEMPGTGRGKRTNGISSAGPPPAAS